VRRICRSPSRNSGGSVASSPRASRLQLPNMVVIREVVAKPLNYNAANGLTVVTQPTTPGAASSGNQGTALVARGLTSFPSHYASAPSGKPSSCNTAYFRCAPRELITDGKGRLCLELKLFERHPYTRQAFFPMGRDTSKRAFVVVVTEDKGGSTLKWLIVDGKPDFDKIQAFVAQGNQGVVYDANHWHTPMAGLDHVHAYLTLAYLDR
jgi:ureidoglycolate hydrolase